jgi:nucleoside-diphosphate-sugar epimerase
MNTLLFDLGQRLKSQRIFLTGGTGFFGRSFLEVVSTLNTNHFFNIQVILLTRSSEKFIQAWPEFNQPSWINFHEGDITAFNFPEGRVDQILHFATPADAQWNLTHPSDMFDTIVNGTRRVLELAAKKSVQNVLLTSSGAVYGKQPSSVSHVPETYTGAPEVFRPGAAYGEGKRVAEFLGSNYAANHEFGFKIARCFAFVGPHLRRDGTFAIGNFIGDVTQNRDIKINGDGTPYRSYLFSEDLIVWLLKILLDGRSLVPYNVGSDEDLSIKALAELVIKVLGSRAKVNVLGEAVPNKLPDRYVPSIELARAELGLRVFTSLEESIRLTANSYRR